MYNEKNKDIDGKASVQIEGKDDNQPLILVICTSLMCINTFIWEIVFIDSSS